MIIKSQQAAAARKMFLTPSHTMSRHPERYNTSKLLNVLWTRELASKVDPKEIIINTVNPGLVRSDLHRENTNAVEEKFTAFFGWTTEEGGRTLVNASVAQGAETHGGYMSECKPTP